MYRSRFQDRYPLCASFPSTQDRSGPASLIFARRGRVALHRACAETEARREAILAEGRARKKAWEAMRREVARTIAALKAERQRLGLSLADVEARSGLKRSALSRLENDPNANPTMLTLQRYATSLGLTLSTIVEQKSV